MKKIIIIVALILVGITLISVLAKINVSEPSLPDGGSGGNVNNPSSNVPPKDPEPIIQQIDGKTYVTPALWILPDEHLDVDGQALVLAQSSSLFSYRVGTYKGPVYSPEYIESMETFTVDENGSIHQIYVSGYVSQGDYMGTFKVGNFDYIAYYFMYADDENHVLHSLSEKEGGVQIFEITNLSNQYDDPISKVPYGNLTANVKIRDISVSYEIFMGRDIYAYCFGYVYEDRMLYNAGYAAGYADAEGGKAYVEQSDPVKKQGYNDGFSAGGGRVIYKYGTVEISTETARYICDAEIYAYYMNRGLSNGRADEMANVEYDLARGFDPVLPNHTFGYATAYAEGYRNGYTGSDIDSESNYYLIQDGNTFKFTDNAMLSGNPAGYSSEFSHCEKVLHFNATDGLIFQCPVCNQTFKCCDDEITLEHEILPLYYLFESQGGYYFSINVPTDSSEYVYECEHNGVVFCWNISDDFVAACPVCNKLYRFNTEFNGDNVTTTITEVSCYYLVHTDGEYDFSSEIPENSTEWAYEIEHDGVILRLNTTEEFTARCPICDVLYDFSNVHGDVVMTIHENLTDYYLERNEDDGWYLSTVALNESYTYSIEHMGIRIHIDMEPSDSVTVICPVCNTSCLIGVDDVMCEPYITCPLPDESDPEEPVPDDPLEEENCYYLVLDDMGEYGFSSTCPDGVNYTSSVNHCDVIIYLPEGFEFTSITCPVCGEPIV